MINPIELYKMLTVPFQSPLVQEDINLISTLEDDKTILSLIISGK